MIKSFKNKALEKLFIDGNAKGIRADHRVKVMFILTLLDAITSIESMNYPHLRLHILEPRSMGIYAVSISGNWRITFRFEDANVYIVDYLDYH